MQARQHKKDFEKKFEKDFDIIIVGGGHAGLEAACIAAKMGAKVHLLTILVENIALASCNPAMGGLGKGHLIKEIDALGGVMGQISDKCGIQYRTLNASKGPAVRGTRAQIDMDAYRIYARNLALNTQNLSISQEMACEILLDSSLESSPSSAECESKSSAKSKLHDCPQKNTTQKSLSQKSFAQKSFSQKNPPQKAPLKNQKKAIGIRTNIGKTYYADKIIITTGTFLCGLVHIGENQIINGRFGESASNELSESLKKIGLTLGRLKTGTCPRIDGRSIDFVALEQHIGDKNPPYFSYHTGLDLEQTNSKFTPLDLPCFVTYTNEKTHKIIRENFHRAPLFTGQIQGVGPRYCPSIEDKINRFADKERHQLFLEPQTKDRVEYYINGLTTSLPVDIQEQIIHSIKGLENARITRYGYAIEYDFVEPTQLKHTLECKEVDNLYLAGQINGTTGYEEAGALGLMAGINATLSLFSSNSPAGSHCIDFVDFESSQAREPSSLPKSAKNSTSTTSLARIVAENGSIDSSMAESSLRASDSERGNLSCHTKTLCHIERSEISKSQIKNKDISSSHPQYDKSYDNVDFSLPTKAKNDTNNENISCHDVAMQNLAMTKKTTTQNQPLKELVFSRDESYIGVMIDDLVTKGTKEPYRLFTSRAEYRLLLREDNAIYRLLEYAKALGSISPSDYEIFAKEKRDIAKSMAYLESTSITPSKRVQSFLASINQNPLNDKTALVHIVGRYEIRGDETKENEKKDNKMGEDFASLRADFIALEDFLRLEAGQKDSSLRANTPQNANQNHATKQTPNNDKNLATNIPQNLIPPDFSTMSNRTLHQVQILSKYHNYIQKQLADVANSNEMLKLKIPQDFEYKGISGLSLEVIEKLSKARPSTLFEASQISGITPASLDVLHLHIHLRNKKS
ncbi:tRNA uridine-5-carboxymethylaminomethyl modification enzyme MnmG/GidA [Helicobacter sp. T3_23-1056]